MYVYRLNPPALLEFSRDFQAVSELPLSLPPNCGVLDVSPSTTAPLMLIELNCPNGQTVLLLDVEAGTLTQPVADVDSHLLGWMEQGHAAALRIDSLGDPRIIRLDVDTLRSEVIPIPAFTYDLAAQPSTDRFAFSFSRGLGSGSEMDLAAPDGQIMQALYADPYNYLSLADWSPDAKRIAFIKVPDTPTPFTVGELWVMDRDGSNAHKLADADAGHGYAPTWSRDGKRIAFVVRENPQDERANQSSEALISNIYLVDVETGTLTQVTKLANGHVETPFWSQDGNTLAFGAVINDRMEVRIADLTTGQIRSLGTESTCCPAWLRK